MIMRSLGHKGVTIGHTYLQGSGCGSVDWWHVLFLYVSDCRHQAWFLKYSEYLCLLLFLFVCLDLHPNCQDTLHCSYWIVWIVNSEPQVRRTANWLKVFPLGIHAAVITVHANSPRILHPHSPVGPCKLSSIHIFPTQIWPVILVFLLPITGICHANHLSNNTKATSLIMSMAKRLFTIQNSASMLHTSKVFLKKGILKASAKKKCSYIWHICHIKHTYCHFVKTLKEWCIYGCNKQT